MGRNKRQSTEGERSGLETEKTSIHSMQSFTLGVFDKCRTEGSSCQTELSRHGPARQTETRLKSTK